MNISHQNNNNNNINNNLNNNQACAACKYQRKKCAPDCILAPYFPHDRQRQFLNAHKLFGVKKITKIIKHLDPHNKDEAMRSIIFESDMRANDPVGGCYRYIQDLEAQIKYYQEELRLVLQQLAVCRSQAHYHNQHHDPTNNVHNNPIVTLPAPTHYQYIQRRQQQPQEPPPPPLYMVHQLQHQNNSDISLQDDVSACWTSVQDSMSLSIQNNKNGGEDDISNDVYGGEELCNDQKSSSMSLLDTHCEDERTGIGFEPQEVVDHSEEGVFIKIENALIKAEAGDGCFQPDQDHDLKSAATLFTLTNCTA